MEHAAYGKNICQQKPICSSKFGMSQNQERLKIPLQSIRLSLKQKENKASRDSSFENNTPVCHVKTVIDLS